MMYDRNINTNRHDDAIEDARADLRIQQVTARSVAFSAVLVSGISFCAFLFRGDGVLSLPLGLLGILAAIVAAALLVLMVMMYGIGVAGAKHTLQRKIRQRDRYVVRKMAETDATV